MAVESQGIYLHWRPRFEPGVITLTIQAIPCLRAVVTVRHRFDSTSVNHHTAARSHDGCGDLTSRCGHVALLDTQRTDFKTWPQMTRLQRISQKLTNTAAATTSLFQWSRQGHVMQWLRQTRLNGASRFIVQARSDVCGPGAVAKEENDTFLCVMVGAQNIDASSA